MIVYSIYGLRIANKIHFGMAKSQKVSSSAVSGVTSSNPHILFNIDIERLIKYTHNI